MKIWHSVIMGILLCGAGLSLSACGQQKSKSKPRLKPMVEKNITGGGHNGYFQVIHSTKQLKKVLKRKNRQHKEILINTSLNGNTNGNLQSSLQQHENKLQNQMSKLKQKPKLKVSNNVKEPQKQKMNQAKKNQQNQWNHQKQQQKQLNNQIKQTKQNNKKIIQKETQPISIKIPSNTTLVSSPDIHVQNIRFNIKGRNIKLQNINMQVPNTRDIQQQMALNLHHVNGIELNHDNITGVNQMQNVKNKKKRGYQRPVTRGIAIQETGAKHIYMNNSNLSGLATGFNQSNDNSNIKNDTSIKHSQFQGINVPFKLISGRTKLNNISVQYNKGLSLFNITNPEKLTTQSITINVNGEKPDIVANKLLRMARSTIPTYFIGRKIEINGHGYKFITRNGNLQIKSIPSPNNKPINNIGATLSRNDAIRD